jgi:uncharacterized protein (TIGR00106 family)
MIAEFSIIPIGKGYSISNEVAEVLDIVDSSGLPYKINPMGSVVEGSWADVMELVRRCHETVSKRSDRVVTSIKIDDRKNSTDRISGKVESVEQKLNKTLNK